MNNQKISLITLDYPPKKGGVAAYLSNLVSASQGVIIPIIPELRQIWPRWWPLVALCRKEMKAGRIVLASHVFPVGTAALIAALITGGKYAVIFHGLDLRLARGAWKRFLLRLICRRAAALIANSEATKKDLERLVPASDTAVITPGVERAEYPARDEARKALGIGERKKLIVSLARLVPRKGIDKALEAVATIQKEQTVKYVVLGDGDDRERLEKLACEFGTDVLWIRNAEDDIKRLWLAGADIFLLPTRDEVHDVEGFGIVFLEAALAGVPVIAGRSGGVEEAVLDGRTGKIVNARLVDEIKEAIQALLGDEKLRSRMGNLAKQRALKEFQWVERWVILATILGIQI